MFDERWRGGARGPYQEEDDGIGGRSVWWFLHVGWAGGSALAEGRCAVGKNLAVVENCDTDGNMVGGMSCQFAVAILCRMRPAGGSLPFLFHLVAFVSLWTREMCRRPRSADTSELCRPREMCDRHFGLAGRGSGRWESQKCISLRESGRNLSAPAMVCGMLAYVWRVRRASHRPWSGASLSRWRIGCYGGMFRGVVLSGSDSEGLFRLTWDAGDSSNGFHCAVLMCSARRRVL